MLEFFGVTRFVNLTCFEVIRMNCREVSISASVSNEIASLYTIDHSRSCDT